MTNDQKIELFASLSVNEIDELRLMVSFAHQFTGHGNTLAWADILNKAAERKQENYWANFDDITETNNLGI